MANNITELRSMKSAHSSLFEYEIELNGVYSTYARFLKDEIKLFRTFREVYVTSAVIGAISGSSNKPSEETSVQPASIFPNELSRRKVDLKYLYRALMLITDTPGFSDDDYINRAFRQDAEDNNVEKLKENMLIFNEAACRGLDILYNKFRDCDTEDKTINTLYDFLHEFAVDTGFAQDDSLEEFDPFSFK